MRTAIIGGGISGLSAAYSLRKISRQKNFPLEITLFEASDRLGGVFNTIKSDDLIFELGPDSFITSKPWALELVREIGLEPELIKTSERNRKTFVFTEGKLKPLPDGFLMMAPSGISSFLSSDFFSWKAKLRILAELFISRSRVEDEDLYTFVTRRFGKEAFEKAAQPLISGIYTSDPHELSLKATMPQFLEMERENGSVIMGLLKKKYGGGENQSGARYSMFLSLEEGMQSLIDALQNKSDINSLFLNTSVQEIGNDGKWNIAVADGFHEFDSVIVSTPAYVNTVLIKRLDPYISSEFGKIEYASSVVVNLIYDKKDFINKPSGFGVVIPSKENLNMLACSFYTEKFPARNNTKDLVVRCFLGGKLNPDVINWNDEKILKTLKDEMKLVFGSFKEPKKHFIKRYRDAMPQFKVGHVNKMQEIIENIANYKGLALCGNIYCGVGIPDCIKSGKDAAEKITNDLKS